MLLPRYQVSQCRADQPGTLTLTLTGAHIPAAPSVTSRDQITAFTAPIIVIIIVIVVVLHFLNMDFLLMTFRKD